MFQLLWSKEGEDIFFIKKILRSELLFSKFISTGLLVSPTQTTRFSSTGLLVSPTQTTRFSSTGPLVSPTHLNTLTETRYYKYKSDQILTHSGENWPNIYFIILIGMIKDEWKI